MEFGYFTLSDNHYANNSRRPNQFVTDITAEALYAEQIGMHSAWIGEHHFNSLGVLSCPDLVLAYAAAKTKRIRLAPAVTVLPLHHPIRVAEQWATLDLLSNGRVDFACGRGYDRREYEPFSVSFDDNQSVFEEGLEVVHKLWDAEGRLSHHGRHYSFDDVRITPKPVQRPIPTYIGSFSKPSIELAARLGCGLIVAPFASAMSFGGLKQVADLYHESCAKFGNPSGRLMCSYFTHFADNKLQQDAARAGWALGSGRVGAIAGPLLGGVLLAHGWQAREIFIATAIPALGTMASMAILGRLRRSRRGVNGLL